VFAGLFIVRLHRLLASILIAVWTVYAAYPAFDAWWFLRFLLPAWPAMFIGTTAAVRSSFNRWQWGPPAAVTVVCALGIYGLVVTAQRRVFTFDEGERRYATVAQLVAAQTEPDAMILSSIHAGSLRYYGGRATLRFDILDPAWLDDAVAWLDDHGRHPYVLVEDWEMDLFRKQFAARSRLGDLQAAPALAYRAYRMSTTVYLFDLLRPNGPTIAPLPIKDPETLCPGPAPPPAL